MEYPAASYRIKAALIDVVLLLVIFTFTAFAIDSAGGAPSWLRGVVFVVLVYLYDPVTVSLFGGTLGHHVLGVEVRKSSDHNQRISLLMAGIRVFVKYLLGFFSVIVSYARQDHRAIHDLVCDSVVVYKRQRVDTEWSKDY